MLGTPPSGQPVQRRLVFSAPPDSPQGPLATPSPPPGSPLPSVAPVQSPSHTPGSAAAVRRFSSRTPQNTVNTGLGAEEKRIQLWRPAPLLLSEVTTSSSTYTGALPPRAVASPPPASPQYQAPKLPLVGESTSKSAYPGHHPSASPLATDAQSGASPRVKLPLTGESSTKSDYPGHRPSAAAYDSSPTRPANSGSPSKLPLEGYSTTKSAYPGHRVDAALESPSSSVAATTSPARKLPLEGTSTTKSSYPGYRIESTAATSGAEEAASSPARRTLPLVGESTTKSAYPGYRPELVYSDSRAYFEGETTREARIVRPLMGESESHAAFAGWKLPPARPSLGVEMINDAFHEVIEPSMEGEAKQSTVVVTTCADNQSTVEIKVLQRKTNSPLASHAEVLAVLELVGIAPMPAAQAQVAVTFSLSSDSMLTVAAQDVKTGKKQVIAVPKHRLDAQLG